jgi:glycerol-3-phosphate dehydrogenase (NAD(P)+)
MEVKKMTTITIIGAGMMGSAMAWPLSDNGHDVRLVGTHLDKVIIDSIKKQEAHPKHQRKLPKMVKAYHHTELTEALEGTQLIISGVSSFGVEWFVERVSPFLKPEIPVLCITKGLVALENGDLQIIPDHMNDLLPENLQGKISINAVAGPCIAHELAARRHSCVYFCGRDSQVLNSIRQILATSYYHIKISTDFVGTETGVAMKNAYAIAINIAVGQYKKIGADGIAFMYNPQAALFAQSMREISFFVNMMGGEPDGMIDLSGTGDLYVTVFGGRNAKLGQLLGQGYTYQEARQELANETLEGVEILTRVGSALPKLEQRGILNTANFPLLTHLLGVIRDGNQVRIPWETFFADHI